MTLFFDTKVQFLDSETISTIVVFHLNEPLFAVAGFGENRGGSVTLFDDTVKLKLCLGEKFGLIHINNSGGAFERCDVSKSPSVPSNLSQFPPSEAAFDFWVGKW
jgi:hypothetical protein